jgi:hypothetical protein
MPTRPITAVTDRARILTTAVIRAADVLQLSDTRLARVLRVPRSAIPHLRSGERTLNAATAGWDLGGLLVRLSRGLEASLGHENSICADWLRAYCTHVGAVPLEHIESIEGLVGLVRHLEAERAVGTAA